MIAADDWALLTGLTLVLLGTFMAMSAYHRERKLWNDGHCRVCGGTWTYFTTDSQGGLGFRCGCGRCCWISYRSVMRSS